MGQPIQATVCHLLRGVNGQTEVLLGKRQSLFCNGIWNGPGGKVESGEEITRCLYRETKEEIGVAIEKSSARHYASCDFYHPCESGHRLAWQVHFFWVTRWKKEPALISGFSELKWFGLHDLPLKEMMPDVPLWMPAAIQNQSDKTILVGVFYEDKELKKVLRSSYEFVERPVRH